VREAVNHGSGNDGLMQRFQLAVWPELSPDFELLDRLPNREAQDRAYELFRRVDSLEPVEIGATADEGDGWFLRFAEDAQAEYLPALDRLERRLRFSEGHAAMKAHLGKYRGLVPSWRFCSMWSSAQGMEPAAR
jgi:putative DNA primase/helicase